MEINNIDEKLNNSEIDPTVKIRHNIVAKGVCNGYHVAEIEKQVQAHFHKKGDEFYHVLSGEGIINIGKVVYKGEEIKNVRWEPPQKVKVNNVFVIPEGYVHCLKNTSNKNLIISFICPHDHLENDRFVVDNPK